MLAACTVLNRGGWLGPTSGCVRVSPCVRVRALPCTRVHKYPVLQPSEWPFSEVLRVVGRRKLYFSHFPYCAQAETKLFLVLSRLATVRTRLFFFFFFFLYLAGTKVEPRESLLSASSQVGICLLPPDICYLPPRIFAFHSRSRCRAGAVLLFIRRAGTGLSEHCGMESVSRGRLPALTPSPADKPAPSIGLLWNLASYYLPLGLNQRLLSGHSCDWCYPLFCEGGRGFRALRSQKSDPQPHLRPTACKALC